KRRDESPASSIICEPRLAGPKDVSGFVHPNTPGDRSGDFVRDGPAGGLEGQFDLTVVIALVPDHVLEEQDGMVVVTLHLSARFPFAANDIANRLCALIQYLSNAVAVVFAGPLVIGNVYWKLGRIFGDKHNPHVVDMREQLRHRRTVRRRAEGKRT